jgi:hypothetical protein
MAVRQARQYVPQLIQDVGRKQHIHRAVAPAANILPDTLAG